MLVLLIQMLCFPFLLFFAFLFLDYRVLHESLYGYYPTAESVNTGNGVINTNHTAAIRSPAEGVDADLAMALRISEQEQQKLQEELRREQEMLEEVLRLSLEEK